MSQLTRHDQPVRSHQSLSRRPDASLSVGRQRELGGAGVSAVEGPLRLAMADDEGSRCSHRRCKGPEQREDRCHFSRRWWGIWQSVSAGAGVAASLPTRPGNSLHVETRPSCNVSRDERPPEASKPTWDRRRPGGSSSPAPSLPSPPQEPSTEQGSRCGKTCSKYELCTCSSHPS